MHLMELIAALGSAQGALLLLLILFRYRNTKNLPLALLLLTFSLRLGTTPSWNPEMLLAHRWFLPLTGGLPLLFGPLVWWYVRELGHDSPAPPRSLPLHFIPFAVETLLLAVVVFWMSGPAYELFVQDIFLGPAPAWLTIRNVLKIVSGVAYGLLAARIAIRGRDESANVASVRRLSMITIVAVSVLSLAGFGIAAFWPGGGSSIFLIPTGAMALTLYTFSMLVLLEPSVVSHPTGSALRVSRSTASGGSRQCGVAPADRERLVERIQEQMDSDAIMDPSFSLRRLSETLGEHPNRVSYVVNREFGCSLPRLVNRVRIDQFVDRVSHGALADHNILELAYEVGFPSKSTFNRVFKERFGVAPSEYLAAQRGQIGAAHLAN